MIYFIEHPEDKHIKIGTTIRLSQRLQYLRSEYRSHLNVLAVRDGGIREERSLHDRFDHLNVVDEWFHPGPELLGYIATEARAWDGVDETPRPLKLGTLIRVSDEFAEAIRDATGFEKMSAAEYIDLHLLAIVRKRYRDAVIKAAKKMEDKG